MDMAQVSYELFTHNAASLGMMTNHDSTIIHKALENNDNSILTESLQPLQSRRTTCSHDTFPQIIGYTCAEVL